MRWRVQLGINSTSDVWKFCQNWTSRRGESNLENFQTSRVLLFVFSFGYFVKAKFGAFVRIFI
jgi:hypothetical protein